jgi:two-component system alkaline phosphatase synthesis response regulator PhoP
VTKVLIIDDNPSIVRVTSLLLERRGFEVRSSEDDSFLEIAEQWQPSVILMDVHLPKIDGVEATRRLKENTLTAMIPVVLMTGDSEAIDLATQCGANDLIIKPFGNNDLVEMIQRLAKGAGRGEDQPA